MLNAVCFACFRIFKWLLHIFIGRGKKEVLGSNHWEEKIVADAAERVRFSILPERLPSCPKSQTIRLDECIHAEMRPPRCPSHGKLLNTMMIHAIRWCKSNVVEESPPLAAFLHRWSVPYCDTLSSSSSVEKQKKQCLLLSRRRTVIHRRYTTSHHSEKRDPTRQYNTWHYFADNIPHDIAQHSDTERDPRRWTALKSRLSRFCQL